MSAADTVYHNAFRLFDVSVVWTHSRHLHQLRYREHTLLFKQIVNVGYSQIAESPQGQ